MYEISPIITFEPRLYMIAIPILIKNRNGTNAESIVSDKTISERITAINT